MWRSGRNSRAAAILCMVALCAAPAARADEPPQVVEMTPRAGATDVDPRLKELRVTFDRDMSTSGWSFCGGGPTFPEIVGRPRWVDNRTIVVRVRLKPDHDYVMSLNCSVGRKFRSAAGVPLVPVPWTFSTAAKARRLGKAERKQLNARCLKQLMKLLRDHYSYYDYRDVDWKARVKKHRKKILAASGTRSWAKRVAKMLSVAKDLHLWMSYRDQPIATYRRKIRPNANLKGIRSVLPRLEAKNGVVYGMRTDDNVGYILITTLSRQREKELAQVQALLQAYKDCKAMILDLRLNSGGDERLARDIAAWFVEGERVYAKHVYRDSGSKSGFGPAQSRRIVGNAPPRRFDGPVAVLTGPAIMSSAEAMLLMLKQGRRVTLIGAPSYGSSGNPKPFVLDNDVTVHIPSWKALRPDGTCFEGEGIKPGIKIEESPEAFERGDPIIMTALEVVRRKAG